MGNIDKLIADEWTEGWNTQYFKNPDEGFTLFGKYNVRSFCLIDFDLVFGFLLRVIDDDVVRFLYVVGDHEEIHTQWSEPMRFEEQSIKKIIAFIEHLCFMVDST